MWFFVTTVAEAAASTAVTPQASAVYHVSEVAGSLMTGMHHLLVVADWTD